MSSTQARRCSSRRSSRGRRRSSRSAPPRASSAPGDDHDSWYSQVNSSKSSTCSPGGSLVSAAAMRSRAAARRRRRTPGRRAVGARRASRGRPAAADSSTSRARRSRGRLTVAGRSACDRPLRIPHPARAEDQADLTFPVARVDCGNGRPSCGGHTAAVESHLVRDDRSRASATPRGRGRSGAPPRRRCSSGGQGPRPRTPPLVSTHTVALSVPCIAFSKGPSTSSAPLTSSRRDRLRCRLSAGRS